MRSLRFVVPVVVLAAVLPWATPAADTPAAVGFVAPYLDADTVARPGPEPACAVVHGAAVRAAVVPRENLRRVVSESVPAVPPRLGGGSAARLVMGFQWAAVGVSTKPKLALKVGVQTADPAS